MRAYIGGARGKLTNPIRYLAMSTALITLAYVLLMPPEVFVGDVEQGMELAGDTESIPAVETTPEIAEKVAEASRLLGDIESATDNSFLRLNSREAKAVLEETVPQRVAEISLTWMNVFLLAALPINSVIAWILFRKERFNLAEHIAINSYILAFQNFLALAFFFPGLVISMGITTTIYLLCSFCYQFVAWRQVYRLRGIAMNFLGVVAVAASAVCFLILQAVVTFALFLLTSR